IKIVFTEEDSMLKKKSFMLFIVFAAAAMAFPEMALASGGITEFSSPLEKVVNTVTGPAGKYISIVAMAICGIIFIMNKDDISGGFKLLLSVVFGISFIAFAGSMVNSIFSFSGAVL
ncbi:TrbC/VirB2 family protein, partial [Ruthenibacterium lactatiformans]